MNAHQQKKKKNKRYNLVQAALGTLDTPLGTLNTSEVGLR